MRSNMKLFLASDSGATAIEYGLVMSLLTLVCLAGFTALATGSGAMWDNMGGLIGAALK